MSARVRVRLPLPAHPRGGRAGGRGQRARRKALRTAAIALALSLSACAMLREALSPAPQGKPSGRDGWLVYSAGDLRFEAPAGWHPSGDAQRITLEAPDGTGRLEARQVEDRFPSADTCLQSAEQTLRRNSEQLQRVRLHPTTVAGRRGVVMEADRGDQGHGWAWGVCDGGVQYRLFLSGGTPLSKDVLEVYRTLLSTVRIGGEA
jgi:hypothetical protein